MDFYVVIVSNELELNERNFYFSNYSSALKYAREYLESCINYPMCCATANIFKCIDMCEEV